jgi:hypothetical protein
VMVVVIPIPAVPVSAVPIPAVPVSAAPIAPSGERVRCAGARRESSLSVHLRVDVRG